MSDAKAFHRGLAPLARTLAALGLTMGLLAAAPALALAEAGEDEQAVATAAAEDPSPAVEDTTEAAEAAVAEGEPALEAEPTTEAEPVAEPEPAPSTEPADADPAPDAEPAGAPAQPEGTSPQAEDTTPADPEAAAADAEDDQDEIVLPEPEEPSLTVAETPTASDVQADALTASSTSTKKSKRRPLVDGTYVLKGSLASKLVLAAKGKTPKAGANVRIVTYTGANNQKWVVSYDGKRKAYRLYVYGSSKRLALGVSKSGSKINACVLAVADVRNLKTILWSLVDAGSGSYRLVSRRYTKRCLDVAGSKAKAGTNVALVRKKPAATNANQRFEAYNTNPLVSAGSTRLEGSYNALLDANRAVAVDVKGSGSNNLVLRAADGALTQRLYLKRDAKGFYTAWVIGGGKVLEVKGSGVLPGTVVRQAKSTNKANQKWAVVATKNSDGSYTAKLQNKGTGLFLGSAGAGAGTSLRGVSGADSTKLVKFRLTACELLEAGIYEIKPAANDQVSLYVSKGLSDNSVNGKMILYKDKNLPAQRFELVDEAGKNTWRVRTAASGGWLTWNGGTAVVQKGKGADKATGANTWRLAFKNGAISLINVESGKALDTAGGASKSNTTMVVGNAGSASSQRFYFEPSSLYGGTYISLVAYSGRRVRAGSSNNAAAKVTTPTDKNLSQVFFVEPSGRYTRLRDYNGRYLTATGKADQSAVTTSKMAASDNQLWKVSIGDGGTITITSVLSGLDLKYKSSAVIVGEAGSYESVWTPMDRTVDAMKERIAQVAIHFAEDDRHGYSQDNRGLGGSEVITVQDGTKVTISAADVDCSELVRQCVNAVLGFNAIEFMWTGNLNDILLANGFVRMGFSASAVQRGDVLWCYGHTGVALGDGKQSDAHGDEYGGLSGPNRGDQTGHEVEVRDLRTGVWTYIYRYVG